MINIHIITLFPKVFKEYFNHSILGRAVDKELIKIHYYNPIDKTSLLKRVDDRPFGGGPGMVLKAEPFLKCYSDVKKIAKDSNIKSIFFKPSGKTLTDEMLKEYTDSEHIVLISGHYEGIDERVSEITKSDQISIGNYTLTGGEIPVMVFVDSLSRKIPGVLGNSDSLEETRISGNKVYTRPEVLEYEDNEYVVPEVLRSGNHKKIDEFRSNE